MRLALAVLTLAGASCVKHRRVEGLVLSVDRAHQSMTVSHRAIPGYMPAMAMPFRVVRPRDLDGLQPGARVQFDLAGSRARKVRKLEEGPSGLRLPPPSNRIAIGAQIPDFTLLDQDARPVRLRDYRGRVVAIDFIYTRCPLPDVCPRLSANFAALQKRVPGVALLSVTIDPEYDRPPILAEYARRYGADPARWRFLTGSLSDIRAVAGCFGLIFWPEENMIAHTAATAVIDPQGRLAALVEGSSYRWEQLRDLIVSR